MSALKRLFNDELDQRSPVQEDVCRVVLHDEDGNDFIAFEKVDYPTFQKSLGSVSDWSLQALLKAGIDPAFPIHTGNPTRLEGISDLDAMNLYLDSVLGEDDSQDE